MYKGKRVTYQLKRSLLLYPGKMITSLLAYKVYSSIKAKGLLLYQPKRSTRLSKQKGYDFISQKGLLVYQGKTVMSLTA